MLLRVRRFTFFFLTASLVLPLDAATVSRQSAEEFSQKLALIQRHGESSARTERRTRLTEDELNSWFMYRAQPVLPSGVSQPQISILGDGRLSGQATIDLDAVAKRRAASGSGAFDPLSLIGGKVPVSVSGILHTRDGQARFEVQRADMSGIPVPVTVLQELLTYYSRSDDRPQGVRLDDIFTLPAKIRQIEVGEGQAVIVQ
jgi:hypothetical protein